METTVNFDADVVTQLENFIAGRDETLLATDVLIRNFGWWRTIVVMKSRIGFFGFEQAAPGVGKLSEYAELPLKLIDRAEYRKLGRGGLCELFINGRRIVFWLNKADEAKRLTDVIMANLGDPRFEPWSSEEEKYSENLTGFIYWATKDPFEGKNKGELNSGRQACLISLGSVAAAVILGLLFGWFFYLVAVFMLLVFGYLVREGFYLKCPECKTFDGCTKLDAKNISVEDGFKEVDHNIEVTGDVWGTIRSTKTIPVKYVTDNVFFQCENCGFRYIKSEKREVAS